MRLIGMGERARELMCRRALERVAFGRPLAAQGVVREQIASARESLSSRARLLVLKTAWLMVVQRIVDDAIHVHGGAGVSGATVVPQPWAAARTLRLADSPDEVHRMRWPSASWPSTPPPPSSLT